jgi:carbon storage regulator
MLILTRRHGESIYIGEDIKITYLSDNCKGSIRIGIEAPLDKEILRDELIPEEKRMYG